MGERFAYITDVHLDEEFPISKGINARKNWLRILEDIKQKNINHIIFGGDIGEAAANSWFFKTLKKFELQITLGNHDTYNTVKAFYKTKHESKQNELCYHFLDHDFNWIFLDSSSNMIQETQMQWLSEVLATAKDTLLFIHHPVLAVPTEIDKKYPLINRENLTQLLAQHGHPITVFCGHYHMNDMQVYKNITQLVTHAASFQVKKLPNSIVIDTSAFGYRIINLNRTDVKTELITF